MPLNSKLVMIYTYYKVMIYTYYKVNRNVLTSFFKKIICFIECFTLKELVSLLVNPAENRILSVGIPFTEHALYYVHICMHFPLINVYF